VNGVPTKGCGKKSAEDVRLPTDISYEQDVKADVLFFDRTPDKQAWTTKLQIYDPRTNLHFTLKENPLKRADLDDFVACYSAKDRTKRKESEHWKAFTYEELTKRDKVNLDIFWLKDESLEDSANLPDPDVIAAEIVEDLEAALGAIRCHRGGLEKIGLPVFRRWRRFTPSLLPAHVRAIRA
jgi:type I restriction enzyme M protein